MSGEWEDRTVRGPAAEYMTAEEFGKLFGVGKDMVLGWVKAGVLPEPLQVSTQTFLYSWEHAVFFALAIKLGAVSFDKPGAVKEKLRREPSEPGGQPTETEATSSEPPGEPRNPRKRG